MQHGTAADFQLSTSLDWHVSIHSVTLIPDSVIPEFAHTGPGISVPQIQLTVCFVQSGIQIYRISYIPDSKS